VAWNFEVAPRFLENLHNTALYEKLYTVHVSFEAFYSRTSFSLSLCHLRLECLLANIKLAFHQTIIKSIMSDACTS